MKALELFSPTFRSRLGKDDHEKRLTDYFSGRKSEPVDPGAQVQSVFVLFTNRSGSNYLAELLETTGAINRAGEQLNWDNVIRTCDRRGFGSFGAYLADLKARAIGGRYAIKASFHQYEFLDRAGLLDACFPGHRVLISERLDKISQAISLVIANKTLMWRSTLAPEKPTVDIEYDSRQIRSILISILDSHRDMEMYLNMRKRSYFRVVYEELQLDPIGVTNRILEFLDINVSAKPDRVEAARQSTDLNIQMRDRFVAEHPIDWMRPAVPADVFESAEAVIQQS